MKKRLAKMAANWSANRRSLTRQDQVKSDKRRSDHTSVEQLLRHVLRAAMRCETPTTENIAAEAGISEECCRDILLLAEQLGFAEYEPVPM